MTDVPEAVRAARDPAEGLAAVIAALAAETGTLHFLDARGMLRLAAVHGVLPPPVLAQIQEIPVGKGMAGLCAERNEPVTWCNLGADGTGRVQPGARTTGLAGSIVVPVRAIGHLCGTLGVANRAERQYTEAEAAQLLACAESLARFAPITPPGTAHL